MTGKSIWAVIAGFLLLAVLSIGTDMLLRGIFPNTFGPLKAVQGPLASVATLAYAAAFGVLSSYLTARLAGDRPGMHAMALGGIVLLFAVGGLIGSWQRAPAWFNIGYLAMILPSAWLGGFLRTRQARV
jgi:hypothetical protein